MIFHYNIFLLFEFFFQKKKGKKKKDKFFFCALFSGYSQSLEEYWD